MPGSASRSARANVAAMITAAKAALGREGARSPEDIVKSDHHHSAYIIPTEVRKSATHAHRLDCGARGGDENTST